MAKAKYIQTPVKNNIKEAVKTEGNITLSEISTGRIAWHLIKRHKFGLVSVYAFALTMLYLFPFLPDVIASLLRS